MKVNAGQVRFATLLLFLLALPVAAQGREQTVRAAPEAEISIRTDNGTVTVTGWERNEVSVRVRSGDSRDVRVSGDDQRIRVNGESGADLDVRVPRMARVQVKTLSGDISTTDCQGSVDLESTSGEFRVAGDPQIVDIEGISGSIHILGRPQRAFLATVSGEIRVPHAVGSVSAETASGGITIIGEGVRNVELNTASGEIVFSGTAARDAVLHLDSASGEVELRLSPDFPATYDLSTVSGQIENDFGPRPVRPRYGAGYDVRFSTGSGSGARIRASSVSGVVRIVKP
jgi:DUF4097 and DUF4098 domain-containing protein YvlB